MNIKAAIAGNFEKLASFKRLFSFLIYIFGDTDLDS